MTLAEARCAALAGVGANARDIGQRLAFYVPAGSETPTFRWAQQKKCPRASGVDVNMTVVLFDFSHLLLLVRLCAEMQSQTERSPTYALLHP